jgi:hypothetical protein
MADVNINIFTNKIYKQGASTVVPGFIQGEEPTPINPSGSGGASEFVPYVGATENFDLGEFGMSAGFFKLDTTPTNTPTDQGTFYWDEDDNTVDIILNGYIMKVGEDLFYPVKNQTGSSIAKGTNVGFAGTLGNSGRLLITPYLADGANPTSRYMGVTAETIGPGEDGKVLWFGRIRGINTNAYNEGDILYASTTVAGAFQTTLPVAPNNVVEVCAVVTKSVNQGVIFVRPQFLTESSKWTASGSDIYRNSKVTIGQTSIIDADLGIKQIDTDSALRIDGLAKTSQINVMTVYEGSVLRTFLTNYGVQTWYIYNGSSEAGRLMYTSPSGRIGITFFNASSTGRSDIKHISAGGISIATTTTGSIPSDQFYFFPTGNFSIGSGTDGGFRLDVNGTSRFQNNITISDTRNIILATGTGTKIGTTTSQKLSFWNATPIVQPTTGIAESAFVENAGGTAVNDDSTFDGYTLRQVVKALRDAGLLA